jgi:hypothetical protein
MKIYFFFVLNGDFIESAILGGHNLFVILFEDGLLFSYYPKLLKDFIILVPKGTKLIDFCSKVADFLLVKLELVFILQQNAF